MNIVDIYRCSCHLMAVSRPCTNRHPYQLYEQELIRHLVERTSVLCSMCTRRTPNWSLVSVWRKVEWPWCMAADLSSCKALQVHRAFAHRCT